MIVSYGLVVVSFLLLVYKLKMENDTMNEKLNNFFSKLARITVFLSLIALGLYYYPGLDYWWYRATSIPFIESLTVYHWANYGIIHIPTLILASWLVFCWFATPALTMFVEFLAVKFWKFVYAVDEHNTATR